MTVQPANNLPANPWGDLETGLDDFGVADAVIPRITIVHKEGVFKDNLTGRKFDKLTVVMLGLVKQRVLWGVTVEDNDKPMCKSTDFEHGYPNISDETPKSKRFPFEKSNFEPDDTNLLDAGGQMVLPCASCSLKEWGAHPLGNKPWCNEQHTLPLMYSPDDDGNFMPALFTVAKSGLKPSKTYITSFSRARRPLYTVYTELSLHPESRGDNVFATPVFKQLGDVDAADWPQYSNAYRDLRSFLTQPPTTQEDGGDEPQQSSNANVPAQPAPPAAPATPAPEPAPTQVPVAEAAPAPVAAPAAPIADDDLPF